MAYTINIRQTVALPLKETFERLSDHNQLGPLLGLPCKRVRDGEDAINGLGSVRTLGVWPIEFDETVTGFEPNSRIDYRITRGSPLRNHRGTVAFAASGEGATQVSWDIEYEIALPVLGMLIKKILARGIGRGLDKIGR